MKAALLHVSGPFLVCVALVNTRIFDSVTVDFHYAEKRVEHLPACLAMPFNCLVNVCYVVLGLKWLRDGDAAEPERSRYMRRVFALMAVLYGPVQWTRLALLRRAPAVLDQWVTLPIFAWVPVWIGSTQPGPARWRARHAAALELLSLLSYGAALAHERGFEAALACHVALAVCQAVRAQLARGNGRTRAYLLLAVLSCAGFVLLKLLDQWLAQFRMFQRLTGHFWSKVCDVLQFHFSFCFLTRLTQSERRKE